MYLQNAQRTRTYKSTLCILTAHLCTWPLCSNARLSVRLHRCARFDGMLCIKYTDIDTLTGDSTLINLYSALATKNFVVYFMLKYFPDEHIRSHLYFAQFVLLCNHCTIVFGALLSLSLSLSLARSLTLSNFPLYIYISFSFSNAFLPNRMANSIVQWIIFCSVFCLFRFVPFCSPYELYTIRCFCVQAAGITSIWVIWCDCRWPYTKTVCCIIHSCTQMRLSNVFNALSGVCRQNSP